MKPSHNLITDLITTNSLLFPNKEAFVFLKDDNNKDCITFQQFHNRCKKIAAQLQSLTNTQKNDTALLMFQPGIPYITAFFGCIYAGIIPVPVYPPNTKSMARIKHIISDTEAKIIFADKSLYNNYSALLKEEKLDEWEKKMLLEKHWLFEDSGDNFEVSDYNDIQINKNQIAFLQYTSGSTSAPKGVEVSHYNLLHNAELCSKYFGHNQDCTMVSWLPPYHDMGLIGGIFQPLYIGMTAVLMSPISFLKKPLKWLQTISNIKIAGNGFVCSGAPNFAYDFCVSKIKEEDKQHLNLKNWKIAYSGAEPIKGKTIRNFSTYFENIQFHINAFYPVYGLAEGTLLVSAGKPFSGYISKYFSASELNNRKILECSPSDGIEIIGCGNIPQEQTLIIVNPDTLKQVTENEIGEIFLAGDSVTKGYYKNEILSANSFNVELDGFSGKKFLRTGDLGFIYDKTLFIQGRLKDLIIIRGKNYYPQDIEAAISEIHNDIRENTSAVFSINIDDDEQLVIVTELKRSAKNILNSEEIISLIVNTVSKEFALKPHDVVLVSPSTIPKTTSGKIQRGKVKEYYLKECLQDEFSWRKTYLK